ncbi:MAG TPA: hypothetical protein VKU92_03215 [Acidimicrobiales bacterium]|nr:hypothetical protein [Acidimicrobiales bacterium]
MRVLAASALAGALVAGSLAGAGIAGAATSDHMAPTNMTMYAATCANGFTGNVVVRRHFDTKSASLRGKWFVAHVVGGKKDSKVLVPTMIDVTFTFTSSSGTVTTNTENVTKRAKVGKQTTCTLSGTNTVDGGSLSASGSITGAFH